jgi:UDP-N-acetylglucosamine 2-epimerase (non-hydrolysing)
VYRELAALDPTLELTLLHTGQHYDDAMSDVFFRELGMPRPDEFLAVGSGSHAEQTAKALVGVEGVLRERQIDLCVVAGDVNSTIAAALAAVKLGVPIAHIESGLRSFDRAMPEEHNRVLTDHAADLLLAPTVVAMRHLADEGLAGRSRLVGDVMVDVLFRVRDAVAGQVPELPADVDPERPYLVATIHRAENTDDEARLRAIVEGLPLPVVLLTHPRLAARATEAGLPLRSGALFPTAPMPYPALVAAVVRSAGVVTDSGGLQKEAFLLRVPCTTLRTETEWVETVELGWNVLRGDLTGVAEAVTRPRPDWSGAMPYGAGHAAHQVVAALADAAAGVAGRGGDLLATRVSPA